VIALCMGPGSSTVRGGSWNNNRMNARCAYRNRNVPDNFNNNVGFRLVSHDSEVDRPVNPVIHRMRDEATGAGHCPPLQSQRCPFPAEVRPLTRAASQIQNLSRSLW